MRAWPINGRVTAHSVERYRKWTRYICPIDVAEERLKEIITKGEHVLPTLPAVKLLNNNYEEAEYYLLHGLVSVWRDNAIVTMIPFSSHDFYRETVRRPILTHPTKDPKLIRRTRRERAVRDKRKFILTRIKRAAAKRCAI